VQPFCINSHGRMVFPSNFLPDLDFSVIETEEQLDQVIRRDFETKAPSGTEIGLRIEQGKYKDRVALMRDQLPREQRLQALGGEADVAVGRPRDAARGGERVEIGRHQPPVDGLAEHVAAGRFEHYHDHVGPLAGEHLRAQRGHQRDQPEVTAVAILVDPVAGNVERQRVARRIERGAVVLDAEQAVAVAVEVGESVERAVGQLPGEHSPQAERSVAAGARDGERRGED